MVSFRSPAPETSILMVPRGPRFVFITSSSPAAALMFMNSAALGPIVSGQPGVRGGGARTPLPALRACIGV